MSDACTMDFPPDPAFQITVISAAAKAKPVVWIGAAQAKMLYGQQPMEQFLINLLGTNLAGPVTVLCPFCCNILEGVARNYSKLGYTHRRSPDFRCGQVQEYQYHPACA